MKPESIVFAVAGIAFGLIAGWIIGTQQASTRVPATAPAQEEASGSSGASENVAALDEGQVNVLKAIVEREPSNARPRVDLGNLYFDAERFEDAIKWYSDALNLNPSDVNVSTDLGVSYYYTNQPARALQQFDHSLKLDPKHTKTLLNIGVVKAFGEQDLDGASRAWQQVIQIAPESVEGQAAKRALESLQLAHPSLGGKAPKPGA